ncbi:MAG TPA: GntR family transcriptional regulator [Clostridiales bacterium]|nr:GntR family transcriptional regulator [Clostridiales bacterium]
MYYYISFNHQNFISNNEVSFLENNDLSPSKPLFLQIKEAIKEKILNGEYQYGSKIPSENELCKLFNVSRITVRSAISEAMKEGLLFTVQGKGTFVKDLKDTKISQALPYINSFESTIKNLGLSAGTEILKVETIPADIEISKILDINIGTNVLILSLLGKADNEGYVIYNSYFSEIIGNKIYELAKKEVEKGAAFSTLDLYKKLNQPVPAFIEQTFEAVAADASTSKVLNLKKDSPLFLVSSIIYTGNSAPLEYRKAFYRSDKYKFHIKRELSL